MNRFISPLIVLLALATPAVASDGHSHSKPAAAAKSAAPADFADGEVRKVDKEAGKVTIKHGPLANLDMPPMTMVFRVKDPTMLDRMKTGDTIKFKADKLDGNYTVTELQAK
jgi:Cu(I)/Ag(I) efflux system protein CusF